MKLIRETLAALCLLAAIAVLATRYHVLPLQIHTPINGGGNAHGMASKSQLWLLVFLAGWLYILLSLPNLVGPEAANLPASASTQDRAATLALAKVILGWLKLLLMAGLLVWIILLVR